eukprot:4891334-Amphidinium_carterae.1
MNPKRLCALTPDSIPDVDSTCEQLAKLPEESATGEREPHEARDHFRRVEHDIKSQWSETTS